ncbi:basic secretory protein-like protein [Pseudoalteromonas phenolica]|uniref:PKD domain-containing protein n=1 Tax=Pseudoalteromonas phenolica TaxID=161398 RepID=A0A0S2K7Z8_9GAMM|nr:basic secretory protein-like protein [Pseudoalteromonas phenolica]ALO44277.1 PKD domain-containing protein [Pseudoalteromonas phenolica]MBE0357274.1 hypothetical protein [Pseudoalteromonas phenolica O-BC30]RXE94518.1 hypothetical protein D9981_19120 [Pseudoalteromonas phenolica O-BC30]
MFRKNNLVLLLVAAFSQAALAKDIVLYDITDKESFTLKAQHPTFVENESVEQLFDSSIHSKFLSDKSQTWVQIDFEEAFQIHQYSLTSAGDAPARDPKHWQLKGSIDGKNWLTLDSQKEQSFDSRAQTKTYTVADSQQVKHVRFELKQQGKTQWGDSYLQIADIGLFAATDLPLASFDLDKRIIRLNEVITLTNTSENEPDRVEWIIPGAKMKHDGQNAHVSFDKPGSYSVTLKTNNNAGSDVLTQKNVIKVMDIHRPWAGLQLPKVVVKLEDTESAGAKRLIKLLPNIEQAINEVTRDLVPMLYNNFTEVPEFEQVTFRLKWMDTLAYRAGDYSNMEIAFSSKYITEKLADQPDEQVTYELLGVLWHELTHGYQLFPQSATGTPEETHAFIEGVADLIRINAGFHKTRSPEPSDTWLGGYTNTGFFLSWLSKRYEAFEHQFNATATELPDWTFAAAIEYVTGEKVEKLWQEYQAELTK